MLLASNSYVAKAAAVKSFKELYPRFSSKPTGNIAMDMNVKDKQGQSAVFYLKRNGKQGKQDVAVHS